MSRALAHIQLTQEQREKLKVFMQRLGMEKPADRLRMRRRAQVIWFSSPDFPDPNLPGPSGLTVREICQKLGVSKRTVWRCFAAYRTYGIDGLRTKRKWR